MKPYMGLFNALKEKNKMVVCKFAKPKMVVRKGCKGLFVAQVTVIV